MSRRNAFHCVLAFAIRSASPVDGYFSDGLGNELLNMLAKIKGLRGIARTSAFSFKGKCDDIAQHVVTELRTTLSGNAIASAVDVAQELRKPSKHDRQTPQHIGSICKQIFMPMRARWGHCNIQ